MLAIVKKNFLFFIILLSIFGAYFSQPFLPKQSPIYDYLNDFLLAGIFFVQGTQFSKKSLFVLIKKPVILLLSFLSCVVFVPLLTFVVCKVFLDFHSDLAVGLLLMSCMGPPIVSGIIIVKNAQADESLALALTIILNLLSLLTIPINLEIYLSQSIEIEAFSIFLKILVNVLLPAIVGYLFYKKFKFKKKTLKSLLTHSPSIMLACLVFFAFLPYSHFLDGYGLKPFLICAFFAYVLHQIALLVIFFISKCFKNFYESGAIAVCGTQKTFILAIGIWSSFFSYDYPLALIPMIIVNFLQYADILTLRFLKARFI